MTKGKNMNIFDFIADCFSGTDPRIDDKKAEESPDPDAVEKTDDPEKLDEPTQQGRMKTVIIKKAGKKAKEKK